jgi:hypothetical protein
MPRRLARRACRVRCVAACILLVEGLRRQSARQAARKDQHLGLWCCRLVSHILVLAVNSVHGQGHNRHAFGVHVVASPHPKLRFPLGSWGVKGMPFSEPALRVHALLVAALLDPRLTRMANHSRTSCVSCMQVQQCSGTPMPGPCPASPM